MVASSASDGGSGGATAAAGAAGAGGPDLGVSGTVGMGAAGAGGWQGQSGGSGGSAGEPGGGTFSAPAAIAALADAGSFDDDPTFTVDRLELFFNTDRDATSRDDDNLWVSTRATTAAPWGSPTPVSELNSAYRDTTPGVAGNGLTIWFSSTRPGGSGQYDLWVAVRPDRASSWTAAVAVSELNTPTYDVAPQVSASGLVVVVVEQNDPGGAGGHDLYLSSRPTVDAPWGPTQPIAEVNTAANEYAGRLVLDGRVIVFCSDRNPATGQAIYYAARATLDDPFSSPQPLAGINTPADEFDPWPSKDLGYLIFASNRDGGAKLYEAWQ